MVINKSSIISTENPMTQEQKEWIDNADYRTLLARWRFSNSGDEILQGETGKYYKKILERRRQQVGILQHVAISKSIGWEKTNYELH